MSRSEEVSEEFTHTVINEKQAAKYKYEALVSKETKTQLEMEEKVRQSTILNPAVLQATLVTADVLEETSRGWMDHLDVQEPMAVLACLG